MEYNVAKTESLGLPEIVILGVLVISVVQRFVLPVLIELKNEILSLVQDWRFYLFLVPILAISIKLIFQFRKKKVERLAKEEIENRIFWDNYHKEEEKQKKLDARFLPKPKALPPFAWETKVREEEVESEEPKEKIEVNLDLNKIFFKRRSLNIHEIDFLIRQGYQEYSYRSICTGNRENYLLKPRFNESLNHMIVIYDLAEYLKKKKVVHDLYTTRMPDIVMRFGKKEIAFEIETGTVMKNMKKFREKLKLLEENYKDNWYFIVTNRNKIKPYKKYGKVIDPRYIKGQVDKIIKMAEK